MAESGLLREPLSPLVLAAGLWVIALLAESVGRHDLAWLLLLLSALAATGRLAAAGSRPGATVYVLLLLWSGAVGFRFHYHLLHQPLQVPRAGRARRCQPGGPGHSPSRCSSGAGPPCRRGIGTPSGAPPSRSRRPWPGSLHQSSSGLGTTGGLGGGAAQARPPDRLWLVGGLCAAPGPVAPARGVGAPRCTSRSAGRACSSWPGRCTICMRWRRFPSALMSRYAACRRRYWSPQCFWPGCSVRLSLELHVAAARGNWSFPGPVSGAGVAGPRAAVDVLRAPQRRDLAGPRRHPTAGGRSAGGVSLYHARAGRPAPRAVAQARAPRISWSACSCAPMPRPMQRLARGRPTAALDPAELALPADGLLAAFAGWLGPPGRAHLRQALRGRPRRRRAGRRGAGGRRPLGAAHGRRSAARAAADRAAAGERHAAKTWRSPATLGHQSGVAIQNTRLVMEVQASRQELARALATPGRGEQEQQLARRLHDKRRPAGSSASATRLVAERRAALEAMGEDGAAD